MYKSTYLLTYLTIRTGSYQKLQMRQSRPAIWKSEGEMGDKEKSACNACKYLDAVMTDMGRMHVT